MLIILFYQLLLFIQSIIVIINELNYYVNYFVNLMMH